MSSPGKPKKVAFVVGFYPIERGGAEYQAYLLAQRLRNEFKIVFISCGEQADGFFEKDGFEVHTVRASSYRGVRIRLLHQFRKVLRILKEIDPDVIYQRVAGPATAAAARFATKNKKSFVWHIASEANVRPLQPSFKNIAQLRTLERKFVDYGVRHATFAIGQARYQCDLLKRYYGRDCDAVVPNFHNPPTAEIDKSGPFTVVWISNLKSIKRPELFLELADSLQDQDNIKMLMIGRQTMPSISDRLEKATKLYRNFKYMGELTQDQVSEVLARSHLLVNTSEYEGFPNTFIQAWLHQVPVVSLCVDPDRLLTERSLGVCSGSLDALCSDVRRLFDDSEMREEMGRKASLYARNCHSMKNAEIVASFFNR